MNTLLVIALAVGVVSADIGLAYNYQVPQTSYGVPSYQYSGAGDYNTGNTGATGYNYKAQNSGQAGYQGSKFGQQNIGYQTGYQTNNLGVGSSTSGYQTGNGGYQTSNAAGSQSSGLSSLSQPTYQYNGAGASSQAAGYQTYNQYQAQYQNQYQSSAVQNYQEFYNQYQQQPAQIFKHFYVHAAPEEPETPKIRQPIVLPPPQKHYKIIFIKTPTQTVFTPQYVPVPQQNEEKTIVYVLVKKPGEQEKIVVPKVEQKPPTKPEVFFIKYNNKADSQAVINNIVNDYNKGGSSNYVSGAGAQGSGQYNSATGQYSTSSGQSQGSTGQQTQGAYGQYAQGIQSDAQSSAADFGSQSYGGSSGQTLSVASGDASTAGGGYGSTESGGYTSSTGSTNSVASNLNFGSLDAISTSQGVPHEAYGPPKFRE